MIETNNKYECLPYKFSITEHVTFEKLESVCKECEFYPYCDEYKEAELTVLDII